jgi:uncharacterized protein (TIGR00369 family)
MTELLDGHIFGEDQPCFGCSPTHPIGFRLKFESDGGSVLTRFTPREQHQGPPGIMHGGLVSTLADEVAAWAIIVLLEKFGFTAQMEAKFKKPIRVGREVVGRAEIVKHTGRTAVVKVALSQEGEVAFEGTLRFVILDAAGAEQLLGQPLPDNWMRFSR